MGNFTCTSCSHEIFWVNHKCEDPNYRPDTWKLTLE